MIDFMRLNAPHNSVHVSVRCLHSGEVKRDKTGRGPIEQARRAVVVLRICVENIFNEPKRQIEYVAPA